MIGNLGTTNDVTFDLGLALLDIPRYIEKLESLDSTGGFDIIRYPGNKGRKYFTSTLRINDEKVKFDFKAKGFGFFGKGLNYYGPISIITLIRYLAKRRSNDEVYLNCLARSVSRCGYLRKKNQITLTNQNQLTLETIFSLCAQYLSQ